MYIGLLLNMVERISWPYSHSVIIFLRFCMYVSWNILGFEERFLATEDSCVKAVKRLPEFDLYISTVLPLENKGIK